MSAQGTNNNATEEKFDRTYTVYQPNADLGPSTRIVATVLNPSTPPSP